MGDGDDCAGVGSERRGCLSAVVSLSVRVSCCWEML